jgi:hypothetical protein
MVYQVKCAWCGKAMGTKTAEGNEYALKLEEKGIPIVSHSICPECRKKTMEFIEKGDNNNG